MAVTFCEKCGKRVSDEQIAAERCAPLAKGYLCPECTAAAGAKAGRRAAPKIAPVEVPAGAVRPRGEIDAISVTGGPDDAAADAAPPASKLPLLLAPLAAALGVTVALILFWPTGEEVVGDGPESEADAAVKTVALDESPEWREYDAANAFAKANPKFYREQIARYQEFVDKHTDSAYADEARRKIKRLEAKVPLQVAEELARYVYDLARDDKYPDAAVAIDEFVAKYPEGEAAEKLAEIRAGLATRAVDSAGLAVVRAHSDVTRGEDEAAEAKLKELEAWKIKEVDELVAKAREDFAAEKARVEAEAAAVAKRETDAAEEYGRLTAAWSRRAYTSLAESVTEYKAAYGKTKFCRDKRRQLDKMVADAAKWQEIKAGEPEAIAENAAVDIIYRTDFDKSKGRWSGGKVVRDPKRGGNVYEIQMRPKPTQWVDASMGASWAPHVPLARKGYLSFYYYLDGPMPKGRVSMSNSVKGHNGFSLHFAGKYGLKTGEWMFFSVPLEEWAQGREVNFTDDDMARGMGFSFKPYPKETVFRVDDITITNGGYPTLIEQQVQRAEKRLEEMTASADSDPWFGLTPQMCHKLRTMKREGVVEKSILRAGSGLAASSGFVASLARAKLTASKGYKFHPTLTAAGRGRGVAEMKKKIISAVTRLKPETVFIGIGTGDIAAGRTPQQVEPEYVETVNEVLKLGAVPVLVTIALPRLNDPKIQSGISGLNTMVLTNAKKLGVPVINARGLLSSPAFEKKKAFTGMNLSLTGSRALNAAVEDLYRRLEKYVFGRGPKAPPLRPSVEPAGPDVPARRREPKPLDDDAIDEPARPPRRRIPR